MSDKSDDTPAKPDAAKSDKAEGKPAKEKPANVAPDAVKDPNEKTGGKPGMGPEGERTPGGDADPGGG